MSLPTIALCCIVKLENRYIRNFVEYYKGMGVSKVYMYDHNAPDEDDLHDVIGDLIDQGFVELIPWQHHKVTIGVYEAFEDCARNHYNDYDYIIFLDADEFVYLNTIYHKSLPQYLAKNDEVFRKYMGIALNWVTFDDNDQLYYEPIPVQYRFTRPAHNDIHGFYENFHIKTILNCGYIRNHKDDEGFEWGCTSPHFFYQKGTVGEYYCDSNGVAISNIRQKIDRVVTNNAYIRHYRTKTMQEYLDNKIVKLTKFGYINVDFNDHFFFMINQWTAEKQEMYDEYLKKNVVYWNDHMEHYNAEDVRMPKVTIVSCAFDKNPEYPVYEPHFCDKNYDFVLITDFEICSDGWKVFSVDNFPQLKGMTTMERTKYVKTHVFEFCDTPYAIYADSTIQWHAKPDAMIKAFIKTGSSLGFVNHPSRQTIDSEIEAWKKRTGEDYYGKALSLYDDIDEYMLYFCCMYILKNDEKSKAVMDEWWEMLTTFFNETNISRTDQIFLPYVINNCIKEKKLNYKDDVFVLAPNVVSSNYIKRVRMLDGMMTFGPTTGRMLTKYGNHVIRMFHFLD